MTEFEKIIKKLTGAQIEFVLIGGVAAAAHGSAYETNDLDIAYERTKDNIRKIVAFLKSIHAKPRNFPEGIKFILDDKSLALGTNFTFETDLGALDILGEVSGLGSFEKVKAVSEPIELYGHKVAVLSIEGLIRAKQAANRPKDQLHLQELRALQEKKRSKT